MSAPTVSLTVEGYNQPSREILLEVQHALTQARLQKQTSRLDDYVTSVTLSDGSVLEISDLQHVWRARLELVPPPSVELFSDVRSVADAVADYPKIISFISGRVQPPTTQFGPFTPWPDPPLQVRLSPRDGGITTESFAAEKLGLPGAPSQQMPFSSWMWHSPLMYTGAMSAVVQLLHGTGYQYYYQRDFFGQWSEAEGKFVTVADNMLHAGAIASDQDAVPTIVPKNPDAVPVWLGCEYPQTWDNSAGVVWARRHLTPEFVAAVSRYPQLANFFADPDRLWEPFLILAGSGGVFLMPFPRDPASFYDEVREQYLLTYPALRTVKFARNDVLFSSFGGFPVPELPRYQMEWVSAGYALRWSRDFAAPGALVLYGAPSQLHSWTFSETTSEAAQIFISQMNSAYPFIYKSQLVKLKFDIWQKDNCHVCAYADDLMSHVGADTFLTTYKCLLVPDSDALSLLAMNSASARASFLAMSVDPWWDFTVQEDRTPVANAYLEPLFELWKR